MKNEAMTDVKTELRKRVVQFIGDRPGVDFMVERLHAAGMSAYFGAMKEELELICYEQVSQSKVKKTTEENESNGDGVPVDTTDGEVAGD